MTAPVEAGATHSRRWLIHGALCLSVLLVAMGNTIVNVEQQPGCAVGAHPG